MEQKMQFTKATRTKSKLRIALQGPSGSGKTYGALLIAKGIGGKIAVIDTERESASLYTDIVDFDALSLDPPYSPERFLEAIKAAEKSGYDILVIDSITHEWSGSGGCLDINEATARAKYKGNTWSAWSDTTPRHRAFLDAIVGSPLHVIATMRSKTETAQSTDGGKTKVVKLGTKAEQREGAEFEFTTVLDLVHDGYFATVSKDRTRIFAGKDPKPITTETGVLLREWLDSGAEPVTPPMAQREQPENETDPATVSTLTDFVTQINDAMNAADLLAVGNNIAGLSSGLQTALRPAYKNKLAALTGRAVGNA